MFCSKCGLEIVEKDKKECPICNAPLIEHLAQETSKNFDSSEDKLTPEDEVVLRELIEDVNENLEEMPDTDIKSVEIETDEQGFNVGEEGSAEAEGEEGAKMEGSHPESSAPRPEPKAEEEITKEDVDAILGGFDTADKNEAPLKQKRLPKVLPAVAVIVVIVIAAVGGGIFYLKSKQEPSVVIPRPETKFVKKKDKVLKKVLKREEKKVVVEKKPAFDKAAQTEKAKEGTAQKKVDAVKATPEVPAENNMLRQKSLEKITEKHAREKVTADSSFLAEPVAEGETFFTIQVSTMLNKSFAETFVNQLKQKGYPVYVIERENSKGVQLSKIRIGKYKTKAEATRVALSFNEREKMPYLIVKLKSDTPLKVTQDRPAAVFSAPEKKSVLPEYSDDEELLSKGSITQEDLLPSTPERLASRDEKTTEMKVPPESTAKEKKEPVKPVDVKKQTPSFATYSIHAGSYRDRKRAVNEVNRLKSLGFDAYTEEVNLREKGIWHRVKIGRFGTPEEARKVQDKLIQKDNKISSRIVKNES